MFPSQRPTCQVVFDSGVGGLTFLRSFLNLHPKTPVLYVADTLNAPYGEKTKEQVQKFVHNILFHISTHYNIERIFLACNTASAYCKESLQTEFQTPVYSVAEAAICWMNNHLPSGSVDVLATPLTVKSEVYSQGLFPFSVQEKACPSFVPFIESTQFFHEPSRNAIVADALDHRSPSTDYVVLGCTHYPYLKDSISKWYGDNTLIVDPAHCMYQDLLTSKAIEQTTSTPAFSIYTTSEHPHFKMLGEHWMQQPFFVHSFWEKTSLSSLFA